MDAAITSRPSTLNRIVARHEHSSIPLARSVAPGPRLQLGPLQRLATQDAKTVEQSETSQTVRKNKKSGLSFLIPPSTSQPGGAKAARSGSLLPSSTRADDLDMSPQSTRASSSRLEPSVQLLPQHQLSVSRLSRAKSPTIQQASDGDRDDCQAAAVLVGTESIDKSIPCLPSSSTSGDVGHHRQAHQQAGPPPEHFSDALPGIDSLHPAACSPTHAAEQTHIGTRLLVMEDAVCNNAAVLDVEDRGSRNGLLKPGPLGRQPPDMTL